MTAKRKTDDSTETSEKWWCRDKREKTTQKQSSDKIGEKRDDRHS